MQDESSTAVRDKLARQRTELANERTLLAYIRTALGFAIAGISVVWWLEQLGMQVLGLVSLVTSVVILGIGIRRFITIRTQIARQPD